VQQLQRASVERAPLVEVGNADSEVVDHTIEASAP
jgi:hypothetical protein